MKFNLLLAVSAVLLFFIGCEGPTPLISPTHFDRVPRPQNLTASADTTDLGKNYVTLSWSVSDSGKVKNYDIYRAFDVDKQFSSIALSYKFRTYVDSSMGKNRDSVYYYIVAKGSDNFIGQNSDTVFIQLIN